MNATSPPRVSSWRPVAIAPSSSSSPISAFGIRSRPAQNVPRSRALRTWVAYTSAACAPCCAAASPPRPSALSTRIPVAASST